MFVRLLTILSALLCMLVGYIYDAFIFGFICGISILAHAAYWETILWKKSKSEQLK